MYCCWQWHQVPGFHRVSQQQWCMLCEHRCQFHIRRGLEFDQGPPSTTFYQRAATAVLAYRSDAKRVFVDAVQNGGGLRHTHNRVDEESS